MKKNKVQTIAQKIEEKVKARRTVIVSFTYNGKPRNVTVGANIGKGFEKRGSELKGTGVTWGSTEGPRACIQVKDGKYYLRGFENTRPEGTTENEHRFKVFDIDKIEGKINGI